MQKQLAKNLFYEGQSSPRKAREALVSLAIHSALFASGDIVYTKVVAQLRETFGCEIVDCYGKPHFLSEVLFNLDKEKRDKVMGSIRDGLVPFSSIKPISSFLNALVSF